MTEEKKQAKRNPNRKRDVHFNFWATEEESALIRERMASLGVVSFGAYMRKVAIDGYVINLDLVLPNPQTVGGGLTMVFTVKEMELLCVFHAGTLAATIELLRKAENEPPERMAVVKSVLEKLSGMKDGDTVSLAFEPEK